MGMALAPVAASASASASASFNRFFSFSFSPSRSPQTLISLATRSRTPRHLSSPFPFRRLCLCRCSTSSSPTMTTNGNFFKELYLYNTMTKSKELFQPRDPTSKAVGMYVCGVTPYDFSHIGHARAYVTFDVLFRYLQYRGYNVSYVRNFTDIDDKIIARAKELSEDPLDLSARFSHEFHFDMSALQCLPPTYEPRVSDHITQIIDMISKIIENDCAYVVDGDVYYSVNKFPAYGQLSGRSLEDNRAGERVAVDQRKRNPADFALWKAAKEGEPSWESPWGQGRPGWHIECSAMSYAYLGHIVDIHGGGQDLIFPHHENEIAQSCAACRESCVRFWVHNGFVNVDKEKMSKSLKNFTTIRRVMELYHALALRFFLLGTHYRTTISYSNEQLDTASDRLFYIYQTLHECEDLLSAEKKSITDEFPPPKTSECLIKLNKELNYCMSDDLHTAMVLAALSDPLKLMNDLLHTRKGKREERRLESLCALEKQLRVVLGLLGLMPASYSEVLQELREKALVRAGLTEAQVLGKIEERTSARKQKQYERSDEIRKELEVLGIALMDNPNGTTWRPAIPLHVQELQTAPS
ncbi:cysteinyl-tRNA synthetase, class Ia family protein [Carex rostrata]